MDIGYFKDLAITIGTLVTAFSVLTAGIIFLWKREWQARLKLSIDVDAFCKIEHSFLIEPVCVVENVGLLRCYIYKFRFSVRYILPEDELTPSDKETLLGATNFPDQALSTQLIKEKWGWSYVEAGIARRFSTVTHIPENAVAVLVWAKLFHKKSDDDFFTIQRVFVIENGKLIKN